MGVDIEIDDWESHLNRSLQMAREGAGISPFFEELIIEVDPFFDLSQISSSPHLSKEFSFIELEGFTLLKIGAGLDGPDPKTEFRKSAMISFSNREKDFPRHGDLFSQKFLNAMLDAFRALLF
jgi:hypothetical protein